ncbi:MAG: decaprenyl-phosphate phosphoribosyltransferase [Candidatus Magnetobacterium sp. LHC-1]|uniref:Decaprenyl-phosphate phosphoribosyltransferase n=1 Tax=Candidatus Magnetobacterium casense TaxID=1455061 RepID=A0ABS6S2Y8_9BACT|nr:decaprenyl-phosphate phosphoribosyltransferase [Candidatus Magnetobacterium casensis]MBF0606896.1 decaprenyl-phosphate phosphoribosyltransferase [Nitrospirota bacterium]MBV6342955.1 decaprenyl-phosphate phosphoribosyltransferase [Candidatus Magnetobacterium casensis]
MPAIEMRYKNYIRLLRPRHWLKNLFVLAAPFFGAGLFRPDRVGMAVVSVIAFSMAASATYIINDIIDRKRDLLHPDKALRPIAAGLVGIREALILWGVLLGVALMLAYRINVGFLSCVIVYAVVQIAYCLYLKGVALVDVFIVAMGFVIRVIAGGEAFGIVVSEWLLVSMLMVSLMLATGKRISEAALLSALAKKHRSSMDDFPPELLHDVLAITSAASLISYALYTVEQSRNLVYTVPIVTFGLFRYLHLAHKGKGDPTDAMTSDKWLGLTVLLWLAIVALLRYNYFV